MNKGKKFTAAVAATAVASAMVAPIASASVQFSDIEGSYAKAAILELAEKGIIVGENGKFNPTANIKRQDFAIIMAKALNLDLTKAPATATFSDVPTGHYAFAAVEAAVKAGLLSGEGNGKFGLGNTLTREAMAVIFVNALGVDVAGKGADLKFADAGSISTWAKDAVAFAVEAKLLSGDNNNKFNPLANAERQQVAVVASNFLAKKDELSVGYLTEVKFVDSKTLTVSFSKAVEAVDKADFAVKLKADGTAVAVDSVALSADKKSATVKLAAPLAAATSYTVSYKNRSQEVATPNKLTADVKATGAKKLTVQFNQAIDASKATFEVKKGTVGVNVSKVTVSEDKMSAVLELTTKLTKGEYTVSVAGLETEALTGKVAVENETVASIDLLSDKAPVVVDGNGVIVGATVGYKVVNQYGEDLTNSTPDINWTSSAGTANDDNKGLVGLQHAFQKGQQVVLTGVDAASSKVVTKTLTIVDAATPSEITFDGVYNANNAELNAGLASFDDFVILFDAKDQYGNPVSKAALENDFIVTSSNPLVATVDHNGAASPAPVVLEDAGANGDSLGLQLVKPGNGTNIAGTTTIRLINKFTGKAFTFDVTVAQAVVVDNFTISAPADTIAEGDVVELAFTALDQHGNEYKDKAGLEAIKFPLGSGVEWAYDYVAKKSVLKYTAPAAGKKIITATLPSGKVSTITLDVEAARKPVVVSKVVDLKGALSKGAETTLSVANLKVADQYGKAVALDATFFAAYNIDVVAADGDDDKVALSANAITAHTGAGSSITLAGAVKGTEKLKISLSTKAGAPIDASEIEITEKTVALSDISEYGIADVAKIYDDQAAGYTVDFDVYGKLADGTKVVLADSDFTVNSATENLTYDSVTRTLDADSVAFGNASEVKGKVKVVIVATGETIEKEVTITNVAPVATTFKTKTAGDVTVTNGVAVVAANNLTTAALVGTFSATDQYGETYVINAPKVTFSNLKDADPTVALGVDNNGTAAAAITNAAAGDSFAMTIVLADGKTASLTVIVK